MWIMAVVEPVTQSLFEATRRAATDLLLAWEDDDESGTQELLPKLDRLEECAKKLMKALPTVVANAGEIRRRLHFLRVYLSKGNRKECYRDLVQLIATSLPTMEHLWRSLRTVSKRLWGNRPFLDPVLTDRTHEHLETGRYVDALRAAFPVVTERLRKLRKGVIERDGAKLINELFGDKGKMAPYMDSDERQGMRDLLAGLFTLSRNWVTHNDAVISGLQASAVLLMLHSLLHDLGQLKQRKKRKVLMASRPSRALATTPPAVPST